MDEKANNRKKKYFLTLTNEKMDSHPHSWHKNGVDRKTHICYTNH